MCAATYLAPWLNGILGWQGLGTTALVGFKHPYDSNNRLAVTTVGYEGRNTVLKQLSVETTRDIQRLGHIGLGKQTYLELARIHVEKEFPFHQEELKRHGMKNGLFWKHFFSNYPSYI